MTPRVPTTYPRWIAAANPSTTTAMADCTTSTILRRSMRSASTPAIGPITRKGMERDPAAMPTRKGELEISHTSHGIVIC